MCGKDRRMLSGILLLVLILALGNTALGQRTDTVPIGTVVPLRMDTPLNSNSSRVGDRFTATVFRRVVVGGRVVVPEGAKVEGSVAGINPGERGRRPATIAVAFDRIVFPGNSIPLDATLTSLSEEGRRRIEQDVRYQESGRARRAVVFLGSAGGTAATIGIGSSGDTTTVGGILGTLRGPGDRAEVPAGAEFGMMVERPFSVDIDRIAGDRDTGPQSQDVLTSYESIRSAQVALRDRNYYRGPINGVMNQAMRDAIQDFQEDRNIARTGELDVATARALGIPIVVSGQPGGGGPAGTTGIGNPRQILFLANRLLQDFQHELNIRSNRGQVIFDTRRDFRPNEVELLSQINSLQASADLYSQLTASITDADAIKGAAGGLMRQARLLERIMRRGTQPSSIVRGDWEQLQAEIARINIADINVDNDIIR